MSEKLRPNPYMLKCFEGAGQSHVFDRFDSLEPELQASYMKQLEAVHLSELTELISLLEAPAGVKGEIAPLDPLVPSEAERAAFAKVGWEALEAGRVAVFVVAGGQGTRLGWPGPKGTYPVGPLSQKTLFQLFAEQVLALGERAGQALDFYVLTSQLNRDETEAFFEEHDRFGLAADQLHYLVQANLPNVTLEGRLCLSGPGELATSPNGHGGSLLALRSGGALKRMAEKGQDLLFYWQVDNPLCAIADPVFLGAHLAAEAEASTKIVEKTDPGERVGLVALRDGKPGVVEYSEMTAEQQSERAASGALAYRAGNIAVHLFGREFLEKVSAPTFDLPYHLARKKVAILNARGVLEEPSEPNVVKFERFVFDVLPHAKNHVTLQVERGEEFEPLKNAEGSYSPQTVKAAISARAQAWLEAAGHEVPKGPSGEPVVCEISPLTALDSGQLRERLAGGLPEPAPEGLSL
jgi:UDP-N-acetylglucosamine/UDP-N-acetylgalactosamine diphosphorylase